jgi:predicted DNA binding CopG/RHH family protein
MPAKRKKYKLDAYEQDIEDNLEKMIPVENEEKEISDLRKAAANYLKNQEVITIKIPKQEAKLAKNKALMSGIDYQSYIASLVSCAIRAV